MKLLGVFHSGSDPSAGLLADGHLVAFAEEERFARHKHAAGMFPTSAIRYCLEEAQLALDDVDAIVFPWDASRFDSGAITRHLAEVNRTIAVDDGLLRWQRRFAGAYTSDAQRDVIQRHLRQEFGGGVPDVVFVPHHYAHAAGAFFFSSFREALTFVIDGSGDEHCTTVWIGRDGALTQVASIDIPHSLGWFYAGMTEYLGFRAYDGEYKVMGLAAYGHPNETLAEVVATLAEAEGGGRYRIDPDVFFAGARTYSLRFSDALAKRLGRPPRAPRDPIESWHLDLAFAVQSQLEQIVAHLVRHYVRQTGVRSVCLAGGVAQNVKLNGHLSLMPEVEDIFVLPLSSDAGISACGALAAHMRAGGERPQPMRHVSLGPGFRDEDIQQLLDQCAIRYERPAELETIVADEIARGRVVGWFQGRMEGGPRALGNRSILADPRDVRSRDRVNGAVKHREYWRPFCPSLLHDARQDYFAGGFDSPFMANAFPATDRARQRVPAVVHVDGTMRPQTIAMDTNSSFRRLHEAFGSLTGEPVLLNTSFNVKGEPLVCSPVDAIRCFFGTGLDTLAIGPFLVRKEGS